MTTQTQINTTMNNILMNTTTPNSVPPGAIVFNADPTPAPAPLKPITAIYTDAEIKSLIDKTAGAFVIFEFSFHAWGATKTDKKVTNDVNNKEEVKNGSGRYTKKLMDGEPEMEAIEKHRSKFRNDCKRFLQPHGKAYMIRWDKYLDFKKTTLDPFIAKDRQIIEEFFTAYPNILSRYAMDAVNGKGKLGKLFNRADYPTVDELRALYSTRIHTYPMPKTDYVAQAQSEVGQIIAQTMATEMAERFKEAMQFAWTKLHDSLTWALDTCENIEAGKAGAKVHDVSCKRLLSLADDLKYLNIADDPKLETARQELEVLLNGKSAASLKESLKNDPDARTTIVTKVREMKSLLDF